MSDFETTRFTNEDFESPKAKEMYELEDEEGAEGHEGDDSLYQYKKVSSVSRNDRLGNRTVRLVFSIPVVGSTVMILTGDSSTYTVPLILIGLHLLGCLLIKYWLLASP